MNKFTLGVHEALEKEGNEWNFGYMYSADELISGVGHYGGNTIGDSTDQTSEPMESLPRGDGLPAPVS